MTTKKPSAEERIISGLKGFADALKNGEDVTEKFTCRKVVLNLEPTPYDRKPGRSMKQKDWFDTFQEQRMTRSTDPHTSVLAAESNVSSGRHANQCATVLAALRLVDGATSAEVGTRLPYGDKSRQIAGRRLPDLERQGLVRRGAARQCSVNGTQAVTWWCVR